MKIQFLVWFSSPCIIGPEISSRLAACTNGVTKSIKKSKIDQAALYAISGTVVYL